MLICSFTLPQTCGTRQIDILAGLQKAQDNSSPQRKPEPWMAVIWLITLVTNQHVSSRKRKPSRAWKQNPACGTLLILSSLCQIFYLIINFLFVKEKWIKYANKRNFLGFPFFIVSSDYLSDYPNIALKRLLLIQIDATQGLAVVSCFSLYSLAFYKINET